MKLPKRVLIKFSGELLRDCPDETYSKKALQTVAKALKELWDNHISFGCVLGAGNLFRGKASDSLGFSRVIGDQIGMLGTQMNALALKEALHEEGILSHVMAPRESSPSIMRHDPLRAKMFLERNEPVIFSGGTGNPFFTTDSAAVLRSLEIDASLLIKATKVPGIFSKDPMKYKDAKRFSKITYKEALEKGLQIMDQTAFALAMSFSLPIFVYKFQEPPSIIEALEKDHIGTYVTSG